MNSESAPPLDLSEHPKGDKVTKEMGVEDRIERNQDRGDLKKSTSVKEVEVEIVGIEETEKRSSDQKESNQIQEKEGRDLGQEIKEWSLVSPTKTGRSQTPILQKNMEEIQISASKYSVLDVEEVEEGEMSAGEQNAMEAEENEMSDQSGRLKDDLLEDSILDQQEKRDSEK
ncbi:hypothetical protein DY000_02042644 [Brassica cretica]|uniref:Uncharacterized protein n=1 Tax=Brassica cretica TaxID=69181 RepID=A0ABQ7B959_BRACR|nr:hypothetical protein DY000_02042644 [Brassica cretica]